MCAKFVSRIRALLSQNSSPVITITVLYFVGKKRAPSSIQESYGPMANLKMTCPFWEDHPSFRLRSPAYDFSLMTHMGSLDFCYDLLRFCSGWSSLSISGFVSVSWGWPVPYHWLHPSDICPWACGFSCTHMFSARCFSAQFWCIGLKRVPTVGLLVSGHDLPFSPELGIH